MRFNFRNKLFSFHRQKYSREFRLRARIDGVNQAAEFIQADTVKKVASSYADIAKQALDDGQFERSAQTVLLGERVIMNTYTEAQVTALAASLAARSSSLLPSVHGKPVLDILATLSSDPKERQSEDLRALVIEAHDLYERQIIHLYDTRERTSTRIATLIVFLFVFTISFAFLVYKVPCLAGKLYQSEIIDNNVLIGTFILGGLGACLSALLTLTSLGQSPGAFEGWSALARPLVGAVTGLVAVMFVQASLVTFKSLAAVGLVAFLFGFSERLVIGAVQRLEVAQR